MKVSCIIPAHNEAGQIAGELRVVSTYPGFAEVIVVDDGSTDNTAEIAREFGGVRVIRLPQNQGKSAAIFAGLDAAGGELICLLDADLVGLTHAALDALLAPHKNGRLVTLSRRANFVPLAWLLGMDIWSGERVVPRDLLEKVRAKGVTGYAIECYLNDVVLQEKLPVYSVKWRSVKFVPKTRKIGFWKGTVSDFKMFFTIFKKYPLHKIIMQFIRLPLARFRH